MLENKLNNWYVNISEQDCYCAEKGFIKMDSLIPYCTKKSPEVVVECEYLGREIPGKDKYMCHSQGILNKIKLYHLNDLKNNSFKK